MCVRNYKLPRQEILVIFVTESDKFSYLAFRRMVRVATLNVEHGVSAVLNHFFVHLSMDSVPLLYIMTYRDKLSFHRAPSLFVNVRVGSSNCMAPVAVV